MKTKTRIHAVRRIVSSVLDSDLTPEELHEIANAFIHGGDLSAQIGLLIQETVGDGDVDSKVPEVKADEFGRTGDTFIDSALAWIKRRRLSKARIIEMMGAI